MKNKKIINLILVGMFFIVFASCTPKQEENQSTDDSLSRIKERGKLVVGSDMPYGIMEFFDSSGNPAGIDVEIAKEIASSLGVDLEFKAVAWDLLFDAVKAGEVDIAMSSITITPERSEEMLFSIPYFNGGQVIVVKSSTDDILTPENIAGKKVGVQIETTGHNEAMKYANESDMVTYNSYECVDGVGMTCDLQNGVVKSIIVDYVAALSIVNENSDLKIIGTPFTDEFYGIATKSGNNMLIEEINSVLRDMKRTGKLDEIIKKWS